MEGWNNKLDDEMNNDDQTLYLKQSQEFINMNMSVL